MTLKTSRNLLYNQTDRLPEICAVYDWPTVLSSPPYLASDTRPARVAVTVSLCDQIANRGSLNSLHQTDTHLRREQQKLHT